MASFIQPDDQPIDVFRVIVVGPLLGRRQVCRPLFLLFTLWNRELESLHILRQSWLLQARLKLLGIGSLYPDASVGIAVLGSGAIGNATEWHAIVLEPIVLIEEPVLAQHLTAMDQSLTQIIVQLVDVRFALLEFVFLLINRFQQLLPLFLLLVLLGFDLGLLSFLLTRFFSCCLAFVLSASSAFRCGCIFGLVSFSLCGFGNGLWNAKHRYIFVLLHVGWRRWCVIGQLDFAFQV